MIKIRFHFVYNERMFCYFLQRFSIVFERDIIICFRYGVFHENSPWQFLREYYLFLMEKYVEKGRESLTT